MILTCTYIHRHTGAPSSAVTARMVARVALHRRDGDGAADLGDARPPPLVYTQVDVENSRPRE